MQQMESEATSTAALTVALSRNDADFIKTHLLPSDKPAASVLVRQTCISGGYQAQSAKLKNGTSLLIRQICISVGS